MSENVVCVWKNFDQNQWIPCCKETTTIMKTGDKKPPKKCFLCGNEVVETTDPK